MYSLERKFVLTANTQLHLLDGLWGVKAHGNGEASTLSQRHESTIAALGQIKIAANSVKARGVLRAAGFCEDVYGRLGQDQCTKMRGALLGLKTLVFQYADGLFEIDPAFKESIQPPPDLARKTPQISLVTPRADINLESKALHEEHDKAGRLLKPLLHLVKNDRQESALQLLMASRRDCESDSAVSSAHQTPNAGQLSPRIIVKFETLMHTITNLVLSEARHIEKHISVSYGADFDELGLATANSVQQFIEVLCLNIVRHGVQKEASTQISITGQVQDKAYAFAVSWKGRSLQAHSTTDLHLSREIAELNAFGGNIQFSDDDENKQSLTLLFPRTHRKSTGVEFSHNAWDTQRKGATG